MRRAALHLVTRGSTTGVAATRHTAAAALTAMQAAATATAAPTGATVVRAFSASSAAAPTPPADSKTMTTATTTAASSVSDGAAPDASSTHARYASLLQTLLTINSSRKVRLGVETTARLLAGLGPSVDVSHIPVVHVAGSNGKGSTTVKIARALQLHGLRVGVYTSPHLSSFRERIVVDGRILPEADLVRMLPPMLEAAERDDIPATFFELGTALALAHFRAQQVDVAVVEVGLGGRLDSTNVLQADLAVISSIALEHTQWLGDTIELIAREKAGILKEGRPALIGASVPAEVVRTVAAEVGAGPLHQMKGEWNDYDAENSALATRAMQLLASEECPRLQALLARSPAGGLRQELVERGVRARPPCRFQQVRWDPVRQQGLYLDQDVAVEPEPQPEPEQAEGESDPARDEAASASLRPVEVVLDVCHNPAAFEKLFEKLRLQYDPSASAAADAAASASAAPSAVAAASPSSSSPRPALSIRAVVGFSSDKDFVSCLHMLMRHCSQVCLVQGDTPRAATAAHVLDVARQHNLSALYPSCELVVLSPSPYTTLRQLLSTASSPSTPPSLLLCCGTFFIMSDVRRALRLPHPVDPVAINEQSLKPTTDK